MNLSVTSNLHKKNQTSFHSNVATRAITNVASAVGQQIPYLATQAIIVPTQFAYLVDHGNSPLVSGIKAFAIGCFGDSVIKIFGKSFGLEKSGLLGSINKSMTRLGVRQSFANPIAWYHDWIRVDCKRKGKEIPDFLLD